ncbi:MAG: hypothetical protein R2705_01475 [Ilumatobacteraceae bacterium]
MLDQYDRLDDSEFQRYNAATEERGIECPGQALLSTIAPHSSAQSSPWCSPSVGPEPVGPAPPVTEDARAIAEDRLPDVLGETATPPRSPRRSDADRESDSTDEIGTLAGSFNTVLRTAVETSLEHSARPDREPSTEPARQPGPPKPGPAGAAAPAHRLP